MRQLLGNQKAIYARTAVQDASPEGGLGPKPFASPLAPPRPLGFAEPGSVDATTAAGQRCGASCPIAVIGVEVAGQSRCRDSRPRRTGVAAATSCPMSAAELGELERFGRIDGLVLPLEDRGEPILQGDQSLAAP